MRIRMAPLLGKASGGIAGKGYMCLLDSRMDQLSANNFTVRFELIVPYDASDLAALRVFGFLGNPDLSTELLIEPTAELP